MQPLSDDITRDVFMQVGWEDNLAECERKECSTYSWQFSKKRREAEESGDTAAQQIFGILEDITSMRVQRDSPEEPFGAMIQSPEGRTAILNDFDESRLKLLADVIEDIDDPELKARITDVLFLRKRDFRMGERAVSSYLESAKRLEDPTNWVAAEERIHRALQIAVRLGRNAGSHTAVIEHIEDLLNRCNGQDPLYLSARMMRLLQDRKAGDPVKYADMAEKLASAAESAHDWRRAEEYWEIKAQWHRMNKEDEAAEAARVLAAETNAKEADESLHGEKPNYSLASVFTQKAIVALRRIPGTKERVRELHERLLEYQRKSTSELGKFSSSVDVSDIAQRAVDAVKEQTLQDALMSLARISSSPKIEVLRSQVLRDREKYVAMHLFPTVYLNARGRVIAKQPQSEEEKILAEMYRRGAGVQSMHVQAVIEPARQQILSEHYPGVDDFAPFVVNSPFVPPGREQIIARGLHAGLQGDFLTAVHLLIPQLEESVRYILYQLKVITSGLDDDGVQDEYNLNKMLSASEYTVPLSQVIGEDFAFDLRGLLVERFGSNLRNDTAHGLLSHDNFYSIPGCYLWWLSMRFYSWPRLTSFKHEQSDVDEAET
jgi:hypothetical protein